MTEQSQRICLKCIGDESARELAADRARKVKCSYCGSRALGLSMEGLAAVVDPKIRDYYGVGSETPRYDLDSDKVFYVVEGDDLDDILQDEIGIEYEPAQDLAKLLERNDPADVQDGEDPFYDRQGKYDRRDLFPWEYHESWDNFSYRIKHERRFFDDAARTYLAQILGEAGSAKAAELPTIEIGPETRVPVIHRARLADSERQARDMIKAPLTQLSPPPVTSATAGRMNAAGISVFYGAVSADTAVAEVRPFVGSLVVVGQFRLNRKLRLLDLSQMGQGLTGSVFRPDYEDRMARLQFLQGFHGLIAKPVQPRDEPLEYIPTQAVAEYVANVLGFDGILYGSAQLGTVPDSENGPEELSDLELSQHNVVLFGDAGKVGIDVPAALVLEADKVETKKVRSVHYEHDSASFFDKESDDQPHFPRPTSSGLIPPAGLEP